MDKFVWDVSHQTYPHKILTGRKHGFQDGHFHDITGYTSQHESEHDFSLLDIPQRLLQMRWGWLKHVI